MQNVVEKDYKSKDDDDESEKIFTTVSAFEALKSVEMLSFFEILIMTIWKLVFFGFIILCTILIIKWKLKEKQNLSNS